MLGTERGRSAGAEEVPIDDSLWKSLCGHGQHVTYTEGQFLYLQDAPTKGLFCIDSGQVKNYQILPDGTEAILTLYSARVVIGEAGVFQDQPNICSASAQTAVSAYLIPREIVLELLKTDPRFAQYIVLTLTKKLRTVTTQMCDLVGRNVFSRLAKTLLILEHYGVISDKKHEWYYITHAELASIIGTTRPNVTGGLNRLMQSGALELKRNQIRILDCALLERLSQDLG